MKKIRTYIFIAAIAGAMMVFGAGCGAKKENTSGGSAQQEETTKENSAQQEEASKENGSQQEEATQENGTQQEETTKENGTQQEETTKENGTQQAEDRSSGGEEAEGPQVEITVKDYGTIKLTLDEDNAPITVENFVKLAKEGFYDGLTFHRIIDGFMIQGGDPLGNGTGGSEETIKGEFSENGVDNKISHKRGVISMARSQDMDSASSQFFIVQADSTYLDGQYAGFGYVTEGIEVVDEICERVTGQDQNGTVPKEKQPVIESITVME